MKDPELALFERAIPLTRAFRFELPQAERVAMTEGIYNTLVTIPTNTDAGADVSETSIAAVDFDHFDIFDYQWLAGNRTNALQQPSGIIITASKTKIFWYR